MSLLGQVSNASGLRTTVVTGKDEQGIVRFSNPFQSGLDLAHDVFSLHDEIPIFAKATLPLPLGGRQNGRMRRPQGHVEEKGLLLALARLKVLDRLTGQAGKHVDRRVMGDDLVVLDHCLHVAGVVEATEMVETPVKRTVGNLGSHGRSFVLLSRILIPALGVEILEVKVPLAYDRRMIALLLEKARNGGTALGNQTGSEPLNDSGLQLGTPTVAPGQKAVPGGRAYRRPGVSIGKNHPLRSKLVDMRSRDLPVLRVQALNVAVPEIVANDVNDIGLFPGKGLKKKGKKKQRKESFHPRTLLGLS